MPRYTPPVTKILVIINVVLFLLMLFMQGRGLNLAVVLGAFFPGSPNFHIYQIITHMFMHGGWAHILFNMIALWSFGSAMEISMGSRRFAFFYFVCGIGAFILFNGVNYVQVSNLISSLAPQGTDIHNLYQLAKLNADGSFVNDVQSVMVQGNPEEVQALFAHLTTPMVGASGAIFGLLVGFAMLYPDAKIMLLIPPIPVKAKYLMPILILVELFLGMEAYNGDNVAHFAHLGGAVIGFFLIRHWKRNQFRLR